MNFGIREITLFLILKIINVSSREGYSTSNLNKISFSRTTENILYNNFTLPNITPSTKNGSTSSTNSRFKTNKKWRIGRVTNKQYGIINILWQKTKVFLDQDYSNLTCKATTIEMTPQVRDKQTVLDKEVSKLSTLQGKLQTSTPSYIEFYYLDQSDERIKRKHPSYTKLHKHNKGNKTGVNYSHNKQSPISSVFKTQVNTVRRKHSPQPNKSLHNVGKGNVYRNKLNKPKRTTLTSKLPLTVTTKVRSKNYKKQKNIQSQPTINMFTKRNPANVKTTTHERKVNKSKNESYTTKLVISGTHAIKTFVASGISTAYDKVKFFEMYDNNTPKWHIYINGDMNNMMYNNEAKNYRDEQILLHHVHENIGHQQNKNKTRYVKKHIQDLFSKERKSGNRLNSSFYLSKNELKISLSTPKLHSLFQRNSNWTRPAVWTDFPFVAVYIYEPSQVRCDAAAVSPHWLLSAASCLSRHRKGLRGGGLSAFVTYCGDNWRHSQIISYVKRTLIHPLYHPKDRLRRLFNAGLIQVVNSMADTCSGWAPASLMSHQYVADEKGSIGTAIGWGLDRYDESYTTMNIPRHPLMLYEGRVYSQTCPGSSEYSQTKSLDEVDNRNVYCLLLPPYLAEENDTVHGALLLIGGKLLALYLQEERRPWGEQSAQYVGIWRLLPWVAETAREPDDSFQFDI